MYNLYGGENLLQYTVLENILMFIVFHIYFGEI